MTLVIDGSSIRPATRAYFALQDAEEVKAKVGEIDEWRVLGEVNTLCVCGAVDL